MAKQKDDNNNILTNPQKLKEFKQCIVTITSYLQIIDDQKESIKETVADIVRDFGVDKSIIRKIANTMYKSNYADIQEENQHFEYLYEALNPKKVLVQDPLDKDLDNDDE